MNIITGGLIDFEIKDITKETNKNKFKDYSVTIHTEEYDIWIRFLQSIEIFNNYEINLSDYIYVTFQLPLGDYAKLIHKHRSNLEMTIEYTLDDEIISNRYKFIMINGNENAYGSDLTKHTRELLNKVQMVSIEGQCVLREYEALRTCVIDGSYRNATVEDVIISCINLEAKKNKIEGSSIDMLINMVEADNKHKYEHIVIPTGTSLLKLPTMLQDGDYGVYNSNIGTFLTKIKDKLTLFIYPLNNYERYNKEDKKINIYYSNTNTLDSIEDTHKLDGDVLKILAGSNTKSIDTGEAPLIDKGVGILQNDPRAPLYKETIVTDFTAVTDMNSRLMGNKLKSKKDNVHKNTYIGNISNGYKYRSTMIVRLMSNYQVQWNFSNTDLLHPSMPIKYLYEDKENGMVELTGSLSGYFTRWVANTNVETTLLYINVIKPSAFLSL